MDVLSWSPPDSVLHFQMKILSNLRNVSLQKNSPGSAAFSEWRGLCTINGGIKNIHLKVWSLLSVAVSEELVPRKKEPSLRQLNKMYFSLFLLFIKIFFYNSLYPYPSSLSARPHPHMHWNTDEDAHWTASFNPPHLWDMTGTETKPSLTPSHLEAGSPGTESFPPPRFCCGQVMLDGSSP